MSSISMQVKDQWCICFYSIRKEEVKPPYVAIDFQRILYELLCLSIESTNTAEQ